MNNLFYSLSRENENEKIIDNWYSKFVEAF